ncbi:MAG: 4Fe-4S dicluster domain-containing protein [Bacillota bacterium]
MTELWRIKKCDLPAWLNIWREEYELWGARPEGPVMRYGPVADATELVLQVRTRDSAKNMFFPATETMFSFRHDEQGLELNQQLPELKARLLVGLPSCDLQALLVMDNVFGGGGHADPYYSGRRQYTVVVGVACEPGEFCFCQDFGFGPDTPTGADLFLWDDGSNWLAQAFSEAGARLLQAGDWEKVQATVPNRSGPGGWVSADSVARLRERFDDPRWERLGERCLGCGACAYVCPTCHCFDIDDMPHGLEGGERYRRWDTCAFAGFTAAAGHNPRPDQTGRIRQRVMHKLVYGDFRSDRSLCVGCGRCVAACPAGIDIRAIAREAVREKKEVKAGA